MLSHRNILENSYGSLLCMDIYLGDTFLSFLPLSHMLELTEQLGVSPDPESLNLPEVRNAILARMEKLLPRFPSFVFIKGVALRRAVNERHVQDDIQKIYGQ